MAAWDLRAVHPSTGSTWGCRILATQATLTTATIPSRSDDRIRPRPWQPARDPSAMATGDGQPPPSARSCIHKPRRRPMCDSQGPLLRRNRRPEQRPGAGGRSSDIAEACSRETARWSIEALEGLAEKMLPRRIANAAQARNRPDGRLIRCPGRLLRNQRRTLLRIDGEDGRHAHALTEGAPHNH